MEPEWRMFITWFGQEVTKNASKRISIGDIGQRGLHLKIFGAKLIEECLELNVGTIAVLHVGWVNGVSSDMGLHAFEVAAAVRAKGRIHRVSTTFDFFDAFHRWASW